MMSPMHQGFANGSWLPLALAAVVLAAAASSTSPSAGQLPGDAGVPLGEQALGAIELPRGVRANGEPLPAGTYSVHLTNRTASPETAGALPTLERWVEFRQEDAVVGQEVATIVPAAEIGDVAKSPPPATGSSRVEVLRGNDYVRVWINQGGTHYLIHLAVG